MGPYRALVDAWLEADRTAPRKQRHTAHRVWERLVEEHDAQVAERTVRKYVHHRRRALGEAGEVFVPQHHAPGAEAEVDWGEAIARIAGQRSRVHLFQLRLSHSGAAFAAVFAHETQQAFLEAHVDAFAFLDGVPAVVRYDNLGSAVKQILKGRRRVETDRFVALRSHYLFESAFTIAGVKGAHEKGGIENEVGRFRRRHLVPVPKVRIARRAQRAAACRLCSEDLARRIVGRSETVGEALRSGAAIAARAARRARADRRGGGAHGWTTRR